MYDEFSGEPPSDVKNPPFSRATFGSLLGLPSLSSTQPAGVGKPSLALLRIRPAATVVVAMSSRKGTPSALGAAKDHGSVPRRACLPKVGATWMPEAEVQAMPISPSFAAISV